MRLALLFAAWFAFAAFATAETLQEETARQLGLPVKWTGPGGIEFMLIPPGQFEMGEPGAEDAPPHTVTISTPFYLARTEMTQGQWRELAGTVHSTFHEGPERPVNYVTYLQAQKVIAQLQKTLPGVRLPTEAEWELAARGGTAPDTAWSAENSDNQLHPVGQRPPNGYGLADMLGNVWEWCADFYDADTYRRPPKVDPPGPARSLYGYRVLRGGSALFGAEASSVSNRAFLQESRSRPDIGLRLALTIDDALQERLRTPAN